MDQDDEVRAAMRALATTHVPDLDAVRARLDRGRGRRAPSRRAGRWGAVAVAAAGLTGVVLLWPSPAPAPGDVVVVGAQDGVPVPAPTPPRPTPSTTVPLPAPTSVGPTEPAGNPPSSGTRPSDPPPSGRATSGTPSEPACAYDGRITASPFVVSNNAWNAQPGEGSQCVQRLPSPGSGRIAWTTWWDWNDGTGEVRSFPSAVLGWHWGRSAEETGLPVRLDSGRSVRTQWTYRLEQERPGTAGVTYDLFLHVRSDPDWRHRPDAEVRLVLTPRDGGPGTPLGVVERDGVRWDVYRGGSDWPVYTLVRRGATTTSVDLDVMPVLRDLAPYGLDPALHLSSVEAGVDVWPGRGRLVTTSYGVTVG